MAVVRGLRSPKAPAFAASTAPRDRARPSPPVDCSSRIRREAVDGRDAPSSRGRKAHNCSPSGGTGGVSPGRAEAHAEDARSALTRRLARSYLRPDIAPSHRACAVHSRESTSVPSRLSSAAPPLSAEPTGLNPPTPVSGEPPLVDRDDTIISVPEERVVTSNFGRKVELDLSSPAREFEHHMIPTEKVMDGMAWGFGYAQYWQQRGGHPHGGPFAFFERFKDNVLNNFTEYQLPVINLGKETPKEAVCTVFEKVNTGGVTLNVFELVTASFAAGDFSLRDDWEARRKRMHAAFGVLQGLQGDQFLQAVTLLATQARHRDAVAENRPPNQIPGIGCKRAEILNLVLDEYRAWADRVEEGFRDAAKFLHGQFVFTAGNVPYGTQLVPLAALYAGLGKELVAANAQEKLSHWFWCGVLGEAYGSAVESQFALDLSQVTGYVRGGPEPTLVTEASFIPERLLSLRTRNSAAYKGLYALQMKNGAADWISGEPLSLATWHAEHIDIHHVFPVAWCRGAEPAIPDGLYDSIINKTPIDAVTNRKLGGQRPSLYLKRLRQDIDEDKLNRILETHWIDLDKLENDLFADCFVVRGQAMLDLISRTMRKPSIDGREVFRGALDSAGLTSEPYGSDDEVEYDPVGEGAYGDERPLAEN